MSRSVRVGGTDRAVIGTPAHALGAADVLARLNRDGGARRGEEPRRPRDLIRRPGVASGILGGSAAAATVDIAAATGLGLET